MITKVSYRPYTSDVNNRQKQNQPQKVNFGTRFGLTERELEAGNKLVAILIGCFSGGRANRIGMLQEGISEVLQVLREAGDNRLADATTGCLRSVAGDVERIIDETVAEGRHNDPIINQAGARFMNCLQILSDSSHPNSKVKARLDILQIFQDYPNMTLEELGGVIAQRIGSETTK